MFFLKNTDFQGPSSNMLGWSWTIFFFFLINSSDGSLMEPELETALGTLDTKH